MIRKHINNFISRKYAHKIVKDLPLGFILFIAMCLIGFFVDDPWMILYGFGIMTGYYIAMLLFIYRVDKGLL